jgi:cytochrome c oxidase subunit I
MNTEINVQEELHVGHDHQADVHHDAHGDHNAHEEHKQHFFTKYVFSQDHKIISRQFLITGMIWAIIGGLFSVFFRLQLGFPNEKFAILETFLGHWQVRC